jgi:hypothetical protein
MKKYFLLLLLPLLGGWAFQCSAQAPGFLGRKNILRYDLFFFPASPYHYDEPRNFSGNPGFYFNSSHTAGYERVVSRRHVLGVTGGLMRLGESEANHYDNAGHDQIGHVSIQAWSAGIHLKAYPFFKKGWLAPVGPFVRLEVRYGRETSTWRADADAEPIPHEQHSFMSYSLGMGYSAIIQGRLLLDYGFRLAFSDAVNSAGGGSGATAEYKTATATMIQVTDLLKLHLGLGYIFGK